MTFHHPHAVTHLFAAYPKMESLFLSGYSSCPTHVEVPVLSGAGHKCLTNHESERVQFQCSDADSYFLFTYVLTVTAFIYSDGVRDWQEQIFAEQNVLNEYSSY